MNKVQYNWFYLVIIAFALQACAAYNPVSKAETTEQRAYAIYGTFVIVEEAAAELIASGTLSDDTVLAIAAADERAKPTADLLIEALEEYLVIKAQLAAGESTQEQLDIAVTNLNLWVERVVPLVNTLRAAVEGGI